MRKEKGQELSSGPSIDYNRNYKINSEISNESPNTKNQKTFIAMGLTLFLGCVASAVFLTFSILSSKHEKRQFQFNQQASELVTEIKSTWDDYEYAGLWIHEACRTRNITRKEFKELYEYIQAEGLDFQAAEFVPNITHEMRHDIEAEAEAYYTENYPDINYRGIVGFEPTDPRSPTNLSIQPRSPQPFYFIVHYVEPVESNAAAIHLDLYSSSKRRVTIESALETWKPALTDRLKLVQETDESAYSVLLMHPGIELKTSPDTKPRDLSLLVIRIPSLLLRATRQESENLAVYLYDTTRVSKENAPEFLGGVKVFASSGTDDGDQQEGIVVEYIAEIELEDLLEQDTPVDIYTDSIKIASNTWEVVVVPLESTFKPTFDTAILGGVFLFIGTLAAAFWMYSSMVRSNEMEQLQARAEAERTIVESLFPSNVRDRIIKGASLHRKASSKYHVGNKAAVKPNTKKGESKGSDIESMFELVDDSSSSEGGVPRASIALSSEKIFGSKPIADFFTEVTVMFADLVGFTAWSSARDPTQVFALLEVIYHSFDVIAKKRGVFKLETVGDCYVAACGIPDPREDHAKVMARFAAECLLKLHELISTLEVSMGPDTAELDIRIGLHSGPVTAGVLRGDKGRFQLFGDTMNTANRIESTGSRSKIHVSSDTAKLLREAGKGHWLTERKEIVVAKGKGRLQTYWLNTRASTLVHKAMSGVQNLDISFKAYKNSEMNEPVLALKQQNHNKRMDRLMDWCYDIFSRLLRGVVAKRHLQQRGGKQAKSGNVTLSGRRKSHEVTKHTDDDSPEAAPTIGGKKKSLLDEVSDVVTMPEFDPIADSSKNKIDPDSIDLDAEIEGELREYICVIAELYQRNPFHNFEHAGHVLMSVCKLFTRIKGSSSMEHGVPANSQHLLESKNGIDFTNFAKLMHDNTFGIASDPLTHFACAFAALVHDVDHPGVPNSVLVSEQTVVAATYGNKSVAEQNSIDLAWDLLMGDRYNNLMKCLCPDKNELARFRQLIVNMVMATDVMDKEIGAERKARWEKAFSEQAEQTEDAKVLVNRKASIVIEHLIQASDVSHTMQHWHVYKKWNENLFYEMYKAFKAGRLSFDPSEKWYEGEIGFFDYYVIPLAKKLDTCGVFGVSSDELLSYAEANRAEWESKGKDIVKTYVREYQEKYE